MKKNNLLKLFIESVIQEKTTGIAGPSINIFDRSYQYTTSDSVDDLMRSAIAGQKMMPGSGTKSPSDPKFLQRVKDQLDSVRVPEHVADAVIIKLRMLGMQRQNKPA